MKKSKLGFLSMLTLTLMVISSCTKVTEDPNSEESEAPTIEVVSPNDNDVFYTSEGSLSQADFHFFGRDDVTIDWVAITVKNSANEEVHYEKKIMRKTITSFEMFRNFSTENADTYTVIFEVADTAGKTVEARRTIFFEHRVETDTDL